jgi:hypothetical protein
VAAGEICPDLREASTQGGAFFLLAALILGYAGWQWAATLIALQHVFQSAQG